MVKLILKSLVSALALVLLALSVAASPTSQASASPAVAPCATLTLSASPSVVPVGGTAMVSASITNCSTVSEVVSLDASIGTGCTDGFFYSIPVALAAGQTRAISAPFRAPNCPGAVTIQLTAHSGSTLLDSKSASFTIQSGFGPGLSSLPGSK